MAEIEVAAMFAQFGIAGLVCWMWLVERRSSTEHERRIAELHRRVMDANKEVDVLLRALNDNTRALAAVEAGQRALLAALGRLGEPKRPAG